MKLKKISTLCIAASTLFAASSAMAWESENGEFSTSASVALTSDYMWRGYSQTDKQMAIQGSFDASHSSGLYAGTWASNVDFGDDASSEVDIYAGFSNEFGETGIGYDVGILRYIYPGENYGWNEGYGSLSYSFFNVGVAYSSSVYDTSEDGTYYSAGFDYDLPWYEFSLNAGVGYYDYASKVFGNGNPDNATDYHVGISRDFFGFGVDVSYYDTDNNAQDLYSNRLADNRVVFTISKSM